MNIGPTLGFVILVNNYLHDFATALFVASAAAMWVIARKYDTNPQKDDRAVKEYLMGLFRSMSWLAKLSLFWIVVGGVPRTIFFRDFEWQTAVEHGQVSALMAENAMAFTFVAVGVYLWMRLGRKVRDVKQTLAREKT